jgi:tetratricopeptide (TPR) repeat protein
MANESSGSIEPIVGETGNITKNYIETITQAVETETKKLREQAEQDSNQIVAQAREEANKIIAQARQKAEEESDNLLAQAKEQTEQILKNAHEKASAEAQQESARIINEAKERIGQIIREVIGCDIKTEQNEQTENRETEKEIGEESKVKNEEVEEPAAETEEELMAEDKAESVSETNMKMQEGIALLKSGKNEEALDVFNKVLALDPENALAWNKKSTALDKLGRHTEALKILREGY